MFLLALERLSDFAVHFKYSAEEKHFEILFTSVFYIGINALLVYRVYLADCQMSLYEAVLLLYRTLIGIIPVISCSRRITAHIWIMFQQDMTIQFTFESTILFLVPLTCFLMSAAKAFQPCVSHHGSSSLNVFLGTFHLYFSKRSSFVVFADTYFDEYG